MSAVNKYKKDFLVFKLCAQSSMLFAFLLLLACSLFVNPAESAEEAGKITAVEGVAEILRGGVPPAVPAIPGDPVFIKDIVRTKSDSKVEITFSDGNILRLAQKSRMDISEYVAGTKGTIKLPRGKVQAIVPRDITKRISAQDANRFEIHTPNAVAGVRGTDYFVYHDRNVTGVVVKDGSVHVINPAFPKVVVTVNAGNMTTVAPQTPPQPPKPATEAAVKGLGQETTPEKPKDEKPKDEKPKDDKTAPPTTAAPSAAPQTVQVKLTMDMAKEDMQIISTTGKVGTQTVVEVIKDLYKSVESIKKTGDARAVDSSAGLTPATEKTNENIPITEIIKDTDPPQITFALRPGIYASEKDAIFSLNSNENASFSYDLDNQGWVDLDGVPRVSEDLIIDPMPEGIHTIIFKAVDEAGNISIIGEHKWLTANNQHNLEGGVTGSLSGLIESGKDAKVTNTETNIQEDKTIAVPNIWITSTADDSGKMIGAYNIKSKGVTESAIPSDLKVVTGGSGSLILKDPAFADDPEALSFSGYWMSKITAKASNGKISGASTFTYLTDTALGTGTGIVNGGYGGGQWNMTDVSALDGYTETPLAFGGKGDGGFMVNAALNPDLSFVAMDDNGFMTGRMGGIESLWSGPQSVTLMGIYENPTGHSVWGTDLNGKTSDEGALFGRMGGIVRNNTIEGLAAAIYIRPDETSETGYRAGYIISSDTSGNMAPFTGSQYAGLADAGVLTSGMWDALGTMTATDVAPTDISPEELNESSMCGERPCLDIKTHELKGVGDLKGVGEAESISLLNQKWGIWSALLQSSEAFTATPLTNWKATLGTTDYDDSGNPNSFAIIKLNGSDWADNRLQGTVDGTFLGLQELGTISGKVLGTYDDTTKTWQAMALGVTKQDPLSFVSSIGFASLFSPLNDVASDEGSLSAIIGGVDSLWGAVPARVLMMGAYSPASDKPHLWATEIASNNYKDTSKFYTTYDGGAYQGFIGGTERGNNAALDKNMDAKVYGIYVDPNGKTGILTGDLTGNLVKGIGPDANHLFELDGTMNRTELSVESSIAVPAPDNFIANIVRDTILDTVTADFQFNGTAMGGSTGPAFGFNFGFNVETLSIGNAANSAGWGVWRSVLYGSYSGITASDNWYWTMEHSDAGRVFGTLTTGTKWSDGKLEGATVGFKSDLAKGTTAIVIGETIGVFDPTTFTAVQMGAWMNTNKFLTLAGKIGNSPNLDVLNNLKIPAVEVGRTTFSGSGSTSGGSIDVAMKDVIFFASATGAKPSLWATGDVGGTYFGNPGGASANLASSNGLTVKFDVRSWDSVNKNWDANVKGGGIYTGSGAMNNTDFVMNGTASGKITSVPSGASAGTFSGNGAGWVKTK